MTTILTILTEGFADWETTLLNGVARGYYGAATIYAAPGGRPVTSMGGLHVTPDIALEAVDLDSVDAVVICGGTGWQQPGAPDLTALLRAARNKGKIVGAICDGTVAAARTGILDEVRHTSNGVSYLDGTGYRGAARYEDVAVAVSDGGIITATATAPVSFMAEVMRAIGLGNPELDYFLGLHAAQFEKPRAAA